MGFAVVSQIDNPTANTSYNDILNGSLLANVPADGDYALEVFMDTVNQSTSGTVTVGISATATILIGTQVVADNIPLFRNANDGNNAFGKYFPDQEHVVLETIAASGNKITINIQVIALGNGSSPYGSVRYAVHAVPVGTGLLG